MKKLLLFLSGIFLLGTGALWAQDKKEKDKKEYGTVGGWISEPSKDARWSFPMPVDGVSVMLRSGNDTLRTVSSRGIFLFKKVPLGPATLEFRHLNYETQTCPLEVQSGDNELQVTLRATTHQIGDVVVKSDVLIVTMKGDTLLYNPAAVKTLEGDEALKILEKLPGVEVTEKGITINGEPVARSYVDGKLVFGQDPMAALRNLPASEVERIRVYDEYTDRNPKAKRRKGDEKERVIDVETRSKLSQFTSAMGSASGGGDLSDTGRGSRARYAGGLSGDYFTEKRQAGLSGGISNIGAFVDGKTTGGGGSSYVRTANVRGNLTHAWQTRDKIEAHLTVDYRMEDRRQESRDVTRRDYFATEQWTSRSEYDTLRNRSLSRNHMAELSFDHGKILGGQLLLIQDFSWTGDGQQNDHASLSLLDGTQSAGMATRNRNDGFGRSLNQSTSWSSRRDAKVIFSLDGSFSMSDNNGGQMRLDSLSSSLRSTTYMISTATPSRGYGAGGGVRFRFSEKSNNSFSFKYRHDYADTHSLQTSLDGTDPAAPVPDPVNTFDYTNRSHTNSFTSSLGFHIPKLKANINGGITYRSERVLRDEEYPGEQRYSYPFDAWTPQVFAAFRNNMMVSTMAMYNASAAAPSVEQLREQLDNRDPMRLVAGNPALKQRITHQANLSHNRVLKNGRDFSVRGTMTYTRDPIITNTVFFTQDTPLPQWDGYVAPAQSSLVTYENTDAQWMASASVSFGTPVKAIKSQFRIGLSYSRDDAPSYIGGVLQHTRTSKPGVLAILSTNFTKPMRFTLVSNTGYVHSASALGMDDYLSQGILAVGEVRDIFKKGFASATYSTSFEHYWSDVKPQPARQRLDVTAGIKFAKGLGEVSLTAYDVLNRNTGYSTGMAADHVYYRWAYSFGRYVTLNLSWKFKQAKASSAPGGIGRGMRGRIIRY